uniref:VWFA domain-containing protein n=1 Tax=Strongyloides papillosus TaxID=174720 RepID=A0A0N5C252_STREA
MKSFFISLGILIIFIKNCYSNVIISKSNNSNSVVSFDCTSGSNIVKNTIPFSDCRSDVTIAVDSSSDLLLPMLFNDYELSLIKNNITANWENFSNVSLVWYSGNPTVRTTTGTMETKSNFDLVLSSIKQGVGSNLTKLTEKLVNVPITPGNNLSTFIFITNYDDQDQNTTYQNIQELKKSGSVNFIILGNIIKTQDLEPLQPTNIFYWDFDDNCIPLIVNFFQNSLSCNN